MSVKGLILKPACMFFRTSDSVVWMIHYKCAISETHQGPHMDRHSESEDVTNRSFSGHLLISSFLDLPFPAPSLTGYHPQTSAWGSRKERHKRLQAVYYEEEVDFACCGRFVSLKRNQLTMNSFCGTSFCYIMNTREQTELPKNNSH